MAVPAPRPVTSPVDASMVATPVLLLPHVPPGTELLKVVVVAWHIANVPVIVPGTALTVTTTAADTAPHPLATV